MQACRKDTLRWAQTAAPWTRFVASLVIDAALLLASGLAKLEKHGQTVLLFVTAVYVWLTWRLLRQANRQNEIHAAQIASAVRPLVLVRREPVPGGWEYCVTNVGPGLAQDLVSCNCRN